MIWLGRKRSTSPSTAPFSWGPSRPDRLRARMQRILTGHAAANRQSTGVVTVLVNVVQSGAHATLPTKVYAE